MGEVKWTKEQEQAIYENNSNILVAAAAGSGKTAVLVERIINKIINEKIDIDKLLVVTFTNAAASEMRERILDAIYEKLEKNPENTHLERQVTLINKASICTIDSFCLEVVRNNFYELDNISPNFRIADTTEILLLEQEVLEEIFQEKYEKEDKDFIKLLTTYTSYRDDTPLKDLILKIFSYIQSNPYPNSWLEEKIELFNVKDFDLDFSKTIWGKELLNEIEEEVVDDINILEKVEEDLSFDSELESYSNTIKQDIEMLENLKNNLDNWDKAFLISTNLKFDTWPRKKVESEIKEEAKKRRDDVKKKLTKLLSRILIYQSKEANEDIYDMYKILSRLKNLIFEFEERFSSKKREKNIVDFHDVEHFALDILIKDNKETYVAKKYQEKFSEIAIDEYQDSNLVQEYILTAVSKKNNIFMVGDVKQSIYKFRQAMPELFLDKYYKYKLKEEKSESDDLKIQLFKNFRSRKNILDLTNIIFENIMSRNLGDIEYDKKEFLNLGASYPETNEFSELHIINLNDENDSKNQENDLENNDIKEQMNEEDDDDERIEDIELEAKFVASKIKELKTNNFKVYDRKKDTLRDIKYKDIVILLRATSKSAPIFEQELINLGIPVFSDSSQEYLDSIEIGTIMSLLKIIDNPMQDIPLVTVMRSEIGGFSDNDLVEIRLQDKYDNFYTCLQKAKLGLDRKKQEKITKFLDNLNMWRKEQEYLSLDELIWKIYLDTGYYNYCGLMPNGALRQANLKMLFQRAKQFEASNFKGLYNFIHFIDQLKLSSGDLGAAKIIGENDDVVRILSIHKSKGLEFPVVFLSNTGKQFNLMDLNQNILLHQDMGIGVKYIDYEKQVEYDTLTKVAMKNKILVETLSEEMRILYVALTRAKEKLYITGISKNYEEEIEKLKENVERYKKQEGKINPILLKKYKKYLDWILLVLQYEKDDINSTLKTYVHTKKELLKDLKTEEKETEDIIKKLENTKIDKNKQEEIDKTLNFKYSHMLDTILPTKTSVTEVKKLSMEENTESEEVAVNILDILNNVEGKEESAENVEKETNLAKPEFLRTEKENKLSGAKKGTLIHLAMQKLESKEEYDLDKIKELLEDLAFKKIITENEKEQINPYKILEFTKSNIWNELKEAKEIYKEKPFYMNIDAKELYKKETEEKILVQGIIDLYYITKDDKLVLVDYKTDYVEKGKENTLVEKYEKQLELYQKALEEALNKKVDKKYIYSVYLGKEIEMSN